MNLDFIILIFLDLELLVIIDQVIDFASVDFIHRHSYSEISLMLLEIVYTSIK
jgi:hypothetical protein